MNRIAFSIRPAVPADYAELCRVWEVVDALHREALPHLFRSTGEPPVARADVEALIAGPKSAIIVAVAQGELIGAITMVEKDVEATALTRPRRFVGIENMAVKPFAQRHGVGRALINAVAHWAKDRGVRGLELNVYEFNQAAAAFYGQMGFSTQNRRMTCRLAE